MFITSILHIRKHVKSNYVRGFLGDKIPPSMLPNICVCVSANSLFCTLSASKNAVCHGGSLPRVPLTGGHAESASEKSKRSRNLSVDSHGRSNTRDFENFELIPFSGSF